MGVSTSVCTSAAPFWFVWLVPSEQFASSREHEIRYSGAGGTNGLTVMIDARRYEYFMSQFLSVGFKVK